MESILKVGITINFDKNFFANGLQQNVVILQKLLNELDNVKAFYIWEGKSINETFIDKDECIFYSDLLKDDSAKLDLIIMMGFTLNDKIIIKYKNKVKKSKFVLLQCGNQYIENMSFAIFDIDKKHSPLERLREVDQIWILPHYVKNIPYMSAFFKNDNVFSVPYIWDSLFIDAQINQSIYKDKKIDFFELNKNGILIMEPNLNSSKNCILPLFIVEAFENKFPKMLASCNIFCGNKLVKNDYFIKLILQMDIYNLRKNFLKVHTRKGFIDIIHNYGSIILSHQQDNALNYLYLEALYLGLPLLHNSEFIADYGYYYPDNDIDIALNNLNKIINYHSNNIENYRSKSSEILEKFSYKNSSNKKEYQTLINNLFHM